MALALQLATILEVGILVLLFVLSIWSIAIMIDRRRVLAREADDTELEKLRGNVSSGHASGVATWLSGHTGTYASTLQAARDASEFDEESSAIDRAIRAQMTTERLRLEKGLPILATLGANAPFIGLFGTVLGIIRAFAALGENSGAAANVMSGISHALVATAAGLFVAIPAVVAFNVFTARSRRLLAQCDSLKDLYLARLSALRAKGRS